MSSIKAAARTWDGMQNRQAKQSVGNMERNRMGEAMETSKWKSILSKIAMAVATAMLSNIIISGIELQSYVYDEVNTDLYYAIEELGDMNEAIFGTLVGGEQKKEIAPARIRQIAFNETRLKMNLKAADGDFSWLDIADMELKAKAIMDKETPEHAEIEYLKKVHACNERIICEYSAAVTENGIEYGEIRSIDRGQFKKLYREFLESADKMAKEKEYREIMLFNVECNREDVDNI